MERVVSCIQIVAAEEDDLIVEAVDVLTCNRKKKWIFFKWLDLIVLVSSRVSFLTFIQSGAERCRRCGSYSCIVFGLYNHAVRGRRPQVAQDDALHVPRGRHTWVLPPFEVPAGGVVLPVAHAVTPKNSVSVIEPRWLLRRKHFVKLRSFCLVNLISTLPSKWPGCCEEWGPSAACPGEETLALQRKSHL